jgi:hypothetical protein
MSSLNDFLKDNMIQIIILIFILGGLHSEFQLLKAKVDTLEKRLDKKIEILKGHDKRINKLEK